MAVYEALLLNTVVPQIQAAQAGDSYVMVVNATTPALRITQTGTGNALEVEDEANPDSSPFVVTAAGTVGIGTSSPSAKLQINAGSDEFFSFGSTGAGWNYGVLRHVSSGDLGYIGDGVSAVTGGADTDLAIRAQQGGLLFATNGNNIRATLNASGNLGLGVTPSTKLEIAGNNTGVTANNTLRFTDLDTSTEANQQIGKIEFYSSDSSGSGANVKAYIGAFAEDTTPDAYLAFATGDSGAATERARITSTGEFQWKPNGSTQAMTLDASGNLLVGGTTGTAGGKLTVTTANAGYVAVEPTSSVTNQIATGLRLHGNINETDRYVGIFCYNGAANNVNSMTFWTSNSGTSAERARITNGGNLSLGGTADRATTVGTKALNIFDGTAPVGTLSNGISLYSSSGEAYVMDAAGNATLFSPHDSETNEWIFKSKHTPTGKVLRIDVERLLRFVNDHFGLDAVKEFVEE